ncbi:hypothetical protein DQ244_10840 [Blastococcus sp. TBT05-19]|uniref:hypothetical protein n=1 Tax=Blastococcus sp. TBT05-19 TaxID=2250581 RepID=UPI000DE96C0D|nr:hypothetical protein [Blastococcus sp. TBT05-19]RBY91774.1 hypothetical protein DQ244_10840 [Blastococcus sp. TBT05-19]
MPDRTARVVSGRARVVREVRAAGPLMARLAAPPTARGPWLTAVLNQGAAHRWSGRPVAVVVDGAPHDPPRAAGFLLVRRRGPLAVVELLGGSTRPLPGGRPTARLLARDDDAAELLAAGIVELLASLRGPVTLRLSGLPLGDPTIRALGSRLPTAEMANVRSTRLVDDLDAAGRVERSRDPRVVERLLPRFLDAEPDRRSRDFLRATARLHAALGQLEVAVLDADRGALLTLVDGTDRWPWLGIGADLGAEMGAPLVGLTVAPRAWPGLPWISPR